ncbi:MAG: sugar ABC transporter substrate-binding protein [Spirochaetales bacterium]|nr:sugar ABC transporter substrate-binding protein [Spirochaetales bacterium]
MKKIFLVLFCFILCASAFAMGDNEAKGDRTTTLSLGLWPEESRTADVASMTELKKQFEAKYPDIAVKPAHYKYQPDTFIPMAAAGQVPTIIETWFTEPGKIIDAGYAADISAVLNELGYMTKMNDSVKTMVSRGGKVFAIPRDAYALGLYINLNVYKKAGLLDANGMPKYPKTFDELAKTAKIIKDKTGIPGMMITSKDNVGGWHFTNLAWAFGAEFEKKVNGKWMANLDSPEVIAAMNYVKDLKWKYDVLPESTLLGWGDWIQYFGTDKIGMCFAAADVVGIPVNDYKMDRNAIAIAPIPKGPGGQYSLMGGTIYIFSHTATPAEVIAAFKWLDFTGRLPKIDEESMKNREIDLQAKVDAGEPVGCYPLPVWNDKAYNDSIEQLNRKYANINMDLFKDYYTIAPKTLKAEEPYATQDLYRTLDGVIQVVLGDKNADPAALLKEANDTFQKGFMDKVK